MKQWDAEAYEGGYSFVWQGAEGLLDLLAAAPGERILDLGCGTGHLTARIAELGAEVTGIDADTAMIAQAGANYPQLRFQVADATSFQFPQTFDAVFSNAVLHWISDQAAALRTVRQALRPGGRLAAEFGGQGNVGRIVRAIQEALDLAGYGRPELPWFYPSPTEYARLLEEHGFVLRHLAYFDRMTPLDAAEGMLGWLRMFAGELLRAVPPEEIGAIHKQVEERLKADLNWNGVWHADYVRLRILAVRR